MTRERDLTAAFIDLADTLVVDYDVADLLYRLVEHSIGLLDVAEAGLLLSDQRGGLHFMAASDERTRLLELFQLQSDEGPCLDCYHSGQPVIVPDMRDAIGRWPQFAPAAISEGYVAVHALPLRLRDEVIGAMNLFSTQTGALTADALHLGRALAEMATIGILHERAIRRQEAISEQLEGALHSRIVIEQAKGVLAERGGIEMDDAFRRLRTYARSHGERLTRLARSIAEGDFDADRIFIQDSDVESPAGSPAQ